MVGQTRTEQIYRELHVVEKRVLGTEYPDSDMLRTTCDLAWLYLSHQGKHAEAEQVGRETHDAHARVLGAEYPNTIQTTNILAHSLAERQGKRAEEEGFGGAAGAGGTRQRKWGRGGQRGRQMSRPQAVDSEERAKSEVQARAAKARARWYAGGRGRRRRGY